MSTIPTQGSRAPAASSSSIREPCARETDRFAQISSRAQAPPILARRAAPPSAGGRRRRRRPKRRRGARRSARAASTSGASRKRPAKATPTSAAAPAAALAFRSRRKGRVEHDRLAGPKRDPGLVDEPPIDVAGSLGRVGRGWQTGGLLDCEHRLALDVAAQPKRARRPAEPRGERAGERAFADAGQAADRDEPRRSVAKKFDRPIEIAPGESPRLVAPFALKPFGPGRFDLGPDRRAQAQEQRQRGEAVRSPPAARARDSG